VSLLVYIGIYVLISDFLNLVNVCLSVITLSVLLLLTLVFVRPHLYFKSQFKYFVSVCTAVAVFSVYVVAVTKLFKKA